MVCHYERSPLGEIPMADRTRSSAQHERRIPINSHPSGPAWANKLLDDYGGEIVPADFLDENVFALYGGK
jgi:hypothetical protein